MAFLSEPNADNYFQTTFPQFDGNTYLTRDLDNGGGGGGIVIDPIQLDAPPPVLSPTEKPRDVIMPPYLDPGYINDSLPPTPIGQEQPETPLEEVPATVPTTTPPTTPKEIAKANPLLLVAGLAVGGYFLLPILLKKQKKRR